MFIQWTSLGLVSKGTFERTSPKARKDEEGCWPRISFSKILYSSLGYQGENSKNLNSNGANRTLRLQDSWAKKLLERFEFQNIVPPQSRSCTSKPITIELAGARHRQGAFLWLNSRNSRRALRQMLRHLIIVPFKCVSSWNFHEHRFPIKGICDRLGYYRFPGSFWRCSREWQSIWLLYGTRRVTISYKVLQIIFIAPGNEKIQKLLFSLPVQKFS